MIHNRSAKKYLRHVRSMLPCSRKMKKRIMEQICGEVSLFLEDHPEADYNAVISRFGEPEIIAISFLDSVDSPEVLKKMRTRKWILSAVATVLVFIVLTWTITVACSIIKNERYDGGRVEVVFEDS